MDRDRCWAAVGHWLRITTPPPNHAAFAHGRRRRPDRFGLPLKVFHGFLCFVFRDSGGVCVSCFEISGGSVFRVSLPERLCFAVTGLCFIFVGVIDERWGEESSLLVERTGE